MKPEELYQQLIDIGCTEEFAGQAMNHVNLYSGNLNAFIELVEEALTASDDSKAGAQMDRGSKVVERDYTGDNLTGGGYDFENKSRRW